MTVRMRLSGVCTREQSTLDCCPCLCARGDLWGECFQEPQKMVQGKPYRIIKKRAAERKETSSPRFVFHYGLLTARIQRSPHLLQNLRQMFWLFLFCCALYILAAVFRAATGPSVVFKATAAVVAMAMQGGHCGTSGCGTMGRASFWERGERTSGSIDTTEWEEGKYKSTS